LPQLAVGMKINNKKDNYVAFKPKKKGGASKSNTKGTKIETKIKVQPIANNDGKVKLHETISEAAVAMW